MTERRPTEWGVNVPSKDFGEKVQVQHGVPEIDAVELRSRMDRGDKMVILDTRTPEEYQRNCIPGGRSVPNGELGLHISDILDDVDDATTVIINCAGRTRSIIGARLLQRMGVGNVVGLENGTAGWVLAGYQLESGADRLDLPDPTDEGLAVAEQFADRLVEQDGVRYIDVAALDSLIARTESESGYLIDVRTDAEYAGGHIPGFRWFPGGQAVQRADEVAVVHNAPVVFCCDGRARAAFTASWYRQMGFEEVYAVHGGTSAWVEAGRELASGAPASSAPALSGKGVGTVTADDVAASSSSARVIHVGLSTDFVQGHVPGASWVPRGWLEFRIGNVAPDKDAPIIVTCADGGAQSLLAATTLIGLGYANVGVLEGGTKAWQELRTRRRSRVDRSHVSSQRLAPHGPRPRLRGYGELPAMGGGAGAQVRGGRLRGILYQKSSAGYQCYGPWGSITKVVGRVRGGIEVERTGLILGQTQTHPGRRPVQCR